MNWLRLDSLTFRKLRVFCTVARLLSYTRAAEEPGCQQPTVSALVVELKKEGLRNSKRRKDIPPRLA